MHRLAVLVVVIGLLSIPLFAQATILSAGNSTTILRGGSGLAELLDTEATAMTQENGFEEISTTTTYVNTFAGMLVNNLIIGGTGFVAPIVYTIEAGIEWITVIIS